MSNALALLAMFGLHSGHIQAEHLEQNLTPDLTDASPSVSRQTSQWWSMPSVSMGRK